MTWTHFTSYLDGTRPITTAERDEVFDNAAALLAGDCAAGGYTLNATDLAAVKASQLSTDRTCLDGPAALHLCDRLHALFEAAASAFANYDDAVATALADEGLTEAERDAILAAEVDDHRLWNYYRRLLDELTCGDCAAPIFEVQQRTASCSRYGFPGFTDAAKFFRTCVTRGWGWITGTQFLAQAVANYPVLLCATPPTAAALTGAGSVSRYNGACLTPDTLHPPDAACLIDTETDPAAFGLPLWLDDGDFPDNVTARAAETAFYGPDAGPFPRGVNKLLNEITDAIFTAEVAATARAASWGSATGDSNYGGNYAAYRRASGHIVSLAERHLRLRGKFKVPASGSYRLKWQLWWQPRTWDGAAWVEGAPVFVSDHGWEWDGVTPGGYSAGDSATWPVSPWFELPQPEADGGWFITGLQGECGAVPTAAAPDGLQLVA